jgi:hypothetical protein
VEILEEFCRVHSSVRKQEFKGRRGEERRKEEEKREGMGNR